VLPIATAPKSRLLLPTTTVPTFEPPPKP
jgi:hypothetical protein